MSFLSLEWIATMIATVSLYWLSPSRWRQWLLLVITGLFLLVVSPESAAILVIFAVGIHVLTCTEEVSGLRAVAAVMLVLATLAFFKVRFFDAGGRAGDIIEDVAIPLGLSYYSFRCAHFVFERYRKTVTAPSFKDLLSYLFFLPTLVVGPINRVEEYLREMDRVGWDSRRLSEGLERILFGYVKITVLGNFLATSKLNEVIASVSQHNHALTMYLEVIQDGLTLYFLFAGYSDIAIGFALLLGIRVMENFDWPYFRKNIFEFWRGWHISLSSWSRDYVYFPVLGATRNPYLATLASFAVIGLWHEISLRYIVWGLYHGVGILMWRRFQGLKRRIMPAWVRLPVIRGVLVVASVIITLHYVFFGLVIVNQPSFEEALHVYQTVLFSWI